MKQTTITTALLVPAMLLAANVSTALALDVNAGAGVSATAVTGSGSSTVKVSARVQAQITHAQKRADQELDRRVQALTALKARIGEMKHISDANKTSIQSAIDAQISALTTLKAKIDADTDLATLKTDVQSIAKSYRIYMLIMPQAQIMAAADRMIDVASQLNELAAKLELRINDAKAAGDDTASAEAALADYNAKVADAVTQANNAFTAVASLQPDNGDQATIAANHAALVAARADLKTGIQDLGAARKDFGTIRSDIGKYGSGVKANASTTAETHAGDASSTQDH